MSERGWMGVEPEGVGKKENLPFPLPWHMFPSPQPCTVYQSQDGGLHVNTLC